MEEVFVFRTRAQKTALGLDADVLTAEDFSFSVIHPNHIFTANMVGMAVRYLGGLPVPSSSSRTRCVTSLAGVDTYSRLNKLFSDKEFISDMEEAFGELEPEPPADSVEAHFRLTEETTISLTKGRAFVSGIPILKPAPDEVASYPKIIGAFMIFLDLYENGHLDIPFSCAIPSLKITTIDIEDGYIIAGDDETTAIFPLITRETFGTIRETLMESSEYPKTQPEIRDLITSFWETLWVHCAAIQYLLREASKPEEVLMVDSSEKCRYYLRTEARFLVRALGYKVLRRLFNVHAWTFVLKLE